MKVRVIATALAMCAAAAFTSCTMIDFGWQKTEAPVPPFEPVSLEDYRLGVGDYIEVSIQGDPELADTYTKSLVVLPDGTINYLWNDITGKLYVEGKTPDDVAKMMYNELIVKKRVQPGARISVLVTAVRSQLVYVMGEVRIPGSLSVAQPLTVVQAVAAAGGFTEFADRKNVQLVRREGSKETRWRFNYDYWLKYPRSGKYVDMQLRPGDMIIVPED
ncbi:MAG: polysaccharide biosynthesis/export family protein [Planctomycetota bacterium]